MLIGSVCAPAQDEQVPWPEDKHVDILLVAILANVHLARLAKGERDDGAIERNVLHLVAVKGYRVIGIAVTRSNHVIDDKSLILDAEIALHRINELLNNGRVGEWTVREH